MELIRSKAKEKQKPLVVFFQGTQFDSDWKEPSLSELYFQANTAMTYGVKGIAWFVYDQEDGLGCYRYTSGPYNPIRMPVANKVAKVNHYIKAIGEELIKLESTYVYHSGTLQEYTTPMPINCPIGVSGGDFVVGLYKDENNLENYFMVSNKDFNNPQTANIQLKIGESSLYKFVINVMDNPEPEVNDWKIESRWELVEKVNGSYSEILNAGNGTLFKFCAKNLLDEVDLICGSYSTNSNCVGNPIIGKTVSSCSGTIINKGGDVVVLAADEIVLNNNFEVTLGGQFYAHTQPILNHTPHCSNMYLRSTSNDKILLMEAMTIGNSLEAKDEDSFIIYPNPSKGIVQIKSNLNEKSNVVITVFNSMGLLVNTVTLNDTENETNSIDLTNFKKGMYIIRIETDKIIIHKNHIIE